MYSTSIAHQDAKETILDRSGDLNSAKASRSAHITDTRDLCKTTLFGRALSWCKEFVKMLTLERLASRLWPVVESVNLPFLMRVRGPRDRELGAESETLAFRFKGRVISIKGTSPCRLGAAGGIRCNGKCLKASSRHRDRGGGSKGSKTTVAESRCHRGSRSHKIFWYASSTTLVRKHPRHHGSEIRFKCFVQRQGTTLYAFQSRI